MSIDFGAACKDLFETEKKWMTILGLCVCLIIPIVGPIVALGYLYRRFARVREGKPAEDFDFNHFGEYLQIGLWPFLSSLVLSLFLIPIIFVFMLPIMAAPMMDAENQGLIFGLMALGFVIYVVGIVAYTLVCFPVMLRSGLMMEFKAGFSKSFITSFLRKVGGSLLSYYVLLMLITIPLALVGYLALFVGVYLVMIWVQFVMIHLVFQHYDLYLERGGECIEVNPELTKNYGMPPLPMTPGTTAAGPETPRPAPPAPGESRPEDPGPGGPAE